MRATTYESIFTVPNSLSVLRILMVPVFLAAVWHHKAGAALAIFAAASITDFLDGLFARLLDQKTRLGKLLDPIGDKLLMIGSFIILSYPSLSIPNAIPSWLTFSVIGRDIFILGGSLVLFMARRQKEFPPCFLGKASTFGQMGVLGFVLLFNVLRISPSILQWFYYLCLAATMASAVNYFFIGVRILSRGRTATESSQG